MKKTPTFLKDGVYKVSWHRLGGVLVYDRGTSHALAIFNYNKKNPGKEIPFDAWVRLIIDNNDKRIWIRRMNLEDHKSFDRQYDAVEALGLNKTGYKIQFNARQEELQSFYGVRQI